MLAREHRVVTIDYQKSPELAGASVLTDYCSNVSFRQIINSKNYKMVSKRYIIKSFVW